MTKVLFKEEQSLKNTWIKYPMYLIGFAIIGYLGYQVIRQLAYGEPVSGSGISDQGLVFTFILVTLVISVLMILVQAATLKTEITESGIHYCYPPFIRRMRHIPVDEIREYKVRKYNPILEYGGWGIRPGWRKGKAYNVWGNIGIQLYMKNNKKLLLGTQKKEMAEWAMEKMMKKQNFTE